MPTVAEIAQTASAVAVVVAVVFGVLQIRHLRRARELSTAAELVQAMRTPEFTRCVGIVGRLPDAADPNLVRTDPTTFDAAQHVGHVLECLGVMVCRRILPLHLVDDLLGGYVRMSYRKLRPFIESRRREMGINYGEWTQWLAERMAEHPSPGKDAGAHVAHREWTP